MVSQGNHTKYKNTLNGVLNEAGLIDSLTSTLGLRKVYVNQNFLLEVF